jgi:hypothetical protein
MGNPFILGTAAFNESFNDGKPEDVIWIKTFDPVTGQPVKRRVTPPIQINAMSSTERNFGDRVDIPSLHRLGSDEIRLGVGQVERMYDIPLRDISGLRLDRDMRNAVVRVATVFWEPGNWLKIEQDGTNTKGTTRITKQNVGVAFLRRVAGPSKDAQGNIDKIFRAQNDLYAGRRGSLNDETRDAPSESEEFWSKRRGSDPNYVTRIPPPLFDPGPMGKLKKDIRNTVIPRDAIKKPVMTPEMEEQIRSDRRARAEREKEFERQQEEASKKLAPFLDPESMAAMLRKKKDEPLPPSADTVTPEEEDPYEALAREYEEEVSKLSPEDREEFLKEVEREEKEKERKEKAQGLGLPDIPDNWDEVYEALRDIREYVPDEFDEIFDQVDAVQRNAVADRVISSEIDLTNWTAQQILVLMNELRLE